MRSTLKNELGEELWDMVESHYPHIKKFGDVRVIEKKISTEDPWPGKEKNVYAWFILENGKAVGWNESVSRGLGFSLIPYKLHEDKIIFEKWLRKIIQEVIVEDVQTDREYREQAIKYYNDFLRYFSDKQKLTSTKHLATAERSKDGSISFIYPSNLFSELEGPQIGLYKVGTLRANGQFSGKLNRIKLEVLSKDIDHNKTLKALQKLRSTFIHEFIHWIDYNRSNKKIFKKDRNNDPRSSLTNFTKYISSPGEFNAWFQAAAELIDTTYRDKSKSKKIGETLNTFESFKNYWMKILINQMKYSDSNYRTKLLKRLYTLYVDLKNTYSSIKKENLGISTGSNPAWSNGPVKRKAFKLVQKKI